MSPQITLVRAGTMLRGRLTGDIDPGDAGAPGLFVSDVRVLSRLNLAVNGQACAVASHDSSGASQVVVLAPILPRHETPEVVVSRTQVVDVAGLVDTFDVHNATSHSTTVALVVTVETDFADPFMLRSDRRTFDRSGGTYWSRADEPAAPAKSGKSAAFSCGYRRQVGDRRFEARVSLAASGDATLELSRDDGIPSASIRWQLEIPAGGHSSVTLGIRSARAREVPPLEAVDRGLADSPMAALRRQAIADLSLLRMPFPEGSGGESELGDLTIVAAGAPWFLTLFGRDSMLVCLLAEPDLPGIADDNILALMATQATETDTRRIAAPGKILHELRVSELASLGEVPYERYYGSVDATPLFLSALATVGSPGVRERAEGAARAAVNWMRGAGGIDETGFLRYVSDPHGLITQGWKDSAEAVAHADGTIATGAIALSEVQGYAWRALVDTAHLARDVWHDTEWATELETVADQLRDRFRARFWMPGRDFPALALDGDDRRVEVVTSNPGHLMFSGMLTSDEAARVATRLMDADMFTGWGIRTLSSTEARYSPLAYHNGSVWPHDTMLAAVGMASYGMHGEARILASAMLDAAVQFEGRPAELFGGFDRAEFPKPVTYAHAAVPQAWASAAVLAATRILSGPDQA
jgi:glycogen debranching enzyme